MPQDSFRKQAKWMQNKKNNEFDLDYANILANYTQWFVDLSGPLIDENRGKGLRDIVVHHQGRYQFTGKKEESDYKFFISMLKNTEFVTTDLIADLKKMTENYYVYLDKIFIHFADMLREEIGEQIFSDLDKFSEYLHFRDQMPSSWIYPNILTSEK